MNDGLITACVRKDLKLSLLMIKHGANNLNDALIKSAEIGSTRMCMLLFKHGANNLVEASRKATINDHIGLASSLCYRMLNDDGGFALRVNGGLQYF